MSYENASVPFKAWGNQSVLYDEQLQNEPWIRDFVNAFPRCFEYDYYRYLWVFYPEGDAPQGTGKEVR